MFSDHALTYALFIRFGSVLEVVDDALGSAAAKTPKDVDEKFKKAIEALSAYEKRCHPRETVSKKNVAKKTVAEKMAEAGAKDKSSSTTLNRLKEKLLVRVKPALLLCCNTNAGS